MTKISILYYIYEKKIQTITILKSLKKGPVIKKKKEVKQLKVSWRKLFK